MRRQPEQEKRQLDSERLDLLHQYEEWAELPSLLLGAAWLVLLAVDLLGRLTAPFDLIVNIIWVLFIIDFVIRFVLAPEKWVYLRQNWLTLISLALPALRLLRIARLVRVLRAARAARSVNLVRLVSSLNRGMRALRRTFSRRGFGYMLALTALVVLVGAAGIFALERPPEGNLRSYGDALWWTAMIMTTLGSEYWPQTAEGRLLTFILSVYAFSIFGYVTATLATFFIGRDIEEGQTSGLGQTEISALQAEIRMLRADIQSVKGSGKLPDEEI